MWRRDNLIDLCKDVRVSLHHVELYDQVVRRPDTIAPSDWLASWKIPRHSRTWSETPFWTEQSRWVARHLAPEVYHDRVILFGTVVLRPPGIAPSQWFGLWSD